MRQKTKNFLWMILAAIFGFSIFKAVGKEGFMNFIKSAFGK